jgi:hypothetical protein
MKASTAIAPSLLRQAGMSFVACRPGRLVAWSVSIKYASLLRGSRARLATRLRNFVTNRHE